MTTPSVQLPELDATASGGPAGTDDLLSQMAGEEISRLLSDADIEGNGSSASATPLTPPPLGSLAAAGDGAPADDAANDDDSFEGIAHRSAPVEPPPAAIAPPDSKSELAKGASAASSWAARLLDWLALPLDPFPDEVRDVVGKVAIVTTINAAAVLAYVLIFR